jgi:hypothetical protein
MRHVAIPAAPRPLVDLCRHFTNWHRLTLARHGTGFPPSNSAKLECWRSGSAPLGNVKAFTTQRSRAFIRASGRRIGRRPLKLLPCGPSFILIWSRVQHARHLKRSANTSILSGLNSSAGCRERR